MNLSVSRSHSRPSPQPAPAPTRPWHDHQFWLRTCIVLVVCAASAILAPLAPLPTLIGLAGVVGLLAMTWQPALGLAGLIAASFIVPFEIGTGTGSSLNAPILLLPGLVAFWALDAIARRRRIRVLSSRVILAAAALSASAILAFGVGQLNWVALAQPAPITAQIGGLALFLLSTAALLLAAYQIKDSRLLQWLVWLYLAIAAYYLLRRVGPSLLRLVPVRLTEGSTDSLFYVWTAVLAGSQALFNTRLRWWLRIPLAALTALVLLVGLVLGRDWSSGWLPTLVGLVVMLWTAYPRLGVLVAIPTAIVAFYFYTDVSAALLAGNEYSLLTRVEAWHILAELISINPVTGLGPANYYWYTPLYAILGYNIEFNSHNNYVDIIAQTGLLGLAAFAWLAAEIALLAWRLRRTVAPGFERAYVYGALGGLAGMLASGMLGDWIIPFVYNIGLSGFRTSVLAWVFLGGLVALDFIQQRRHALPSPTP